MLPSNFFLFYYLLIPLLTPLCKYLGLKNLEQELSIIFFETIEGIRIYLEDKEYNINYIKDTIAKAIFDIHRPVSYNQSDNERNVINGARGEIFVYEYFKSLGYEPQCPQISTSNDYDRVIAVKGKDYYYKTSYQNHDMVIENNGVNIYIGSENDFDDDVTVIKTKYTINGEEGTIALIGPKRMEYERVITLLEYIKDNIDSR